jgi:hypothetical protein
LPGNLIGTVPEMLGHSFISQIAVSLSDILARESHITTIIHFLMIPQP